jgi:hypothetical protein
MSAPVLVHPKSGELVINVKSGPAPGEYRGNNLEGPNGALTKFKMALGTRKNTALTAYKQSYIKGLEFDKKKEEIEGRYKAAQVAKFAAKLNGDKEEQKKQKTLSNKAANELAALGAAPKAKFMGPIRTLKKVLGYNATSKRRTNEKRALDNAKRACGWRPEGVSRTLGPSKQSKGDCASETLIRKTLRTTNKKMLEALAELPQYEGNKGVVKGTFSPRPPAIPKAKGVMPTSVPLPSPTTAEAEAAFTGLNLSKEPQDSTASTVPAAASIFTSPFSFTTKTPAPPPNASPKTQRPPRKTQVPPPPSRRAGRLTLGGLRSKTKKLRR